MQKSDTAATNRRLRVTLHLLSAAALVVAGAAHAAPVLRKQIDQHGDFVLFGNTVAQDCASGIPAPVVGTIGACGSNTSDTGADVFWRSESPAAARPRRTLASRRPTRAAPPFWPFPPAPPSPTPASTGAPCFRRTHPART